MLFTETSAKRGTNVEEIFFELGTVSIRIGISKVY